MLPMAQLTLRVMPLIRSLQHALTTNSAFDLAASALSHNGTSWVNSILCFFCSNTIIIYQLSYGSLLSSHLFLIAQILEWHVLLRKVWREQELSPRPLGRKPTQPTTRPPPRSQNQLISCIDFPLFIELNYNKFWLTSGMTIVALLIMIQWTGL